MTILQEFYEKHYKSPSGCEFQALTNAQLRALKMSKEYREFMLENMFEKQAKAIEENRIAVETLCKAVNAMQMSFIGLQDALKKEVEHSVKKAMRFEVPQSTIVDGLINKLNQPLDAGTRNHEEEYNYTVTFRPNESKELLNELDSIAENEFNPERERFDLKSVETPLIDIESFRKKYLEASFVPVKSLVDEFNEFIESWGLTYEQEKLRCELGGRLVKGPLSESEIQQYKELQILLGEFIIDPTTGNNFVGLGNDQIAELIYKWSLVKPNIEITELGQPWSIQDLVKLHRYKHYTKRWTSWNEMKY